MAEMTMVKALNLALRQCMEADERVTVCGQDVGIDDGVFRVTEGLLARFGEKRHVVRVKFIIGIEHKRAIGVFLVGEEKIS